MRAFLCAAALISCAVLAGCDKASSAASAAKDMADDAKKKLAEARDGVLKKFGDLPKIEEAIGKMTGGAQTEAKAAWDSFNKLLGEFKEAPMDKIKELGEKLTEMYEKLKKMAGL